MEGEGLSGDFQEPPQTQCEIQQMRYQKTGEIAHHAVFWKQDIEKNHIQCGGQNVVADADLLLTQALGHGICDGIAVEHGNQQGVQPQELSGIRAAIKPEAKVIGQKEHHATEYYPVKHGDPQAPLGQIGDAPPASRRGAPGKLRDQQLSQTEQNAGWEHEHRKHHAADHSEGCHRIFHQGVQGQTLGHHEIFCGIDAGFQYIRQSQGYSGIPQTSRYRNGAAHGRTFPDPQQNQTGQCQTGTYTAAQHHRLTGPARIVPRPENQSAHSDGHGTKLLRHFHGSQCPDPIRGSEISGHDTAQAGDREKCPKEPQGLHRPGITDPMLCDPGSKGVNGKSDSAAAGNAV